MAKHLESELERIKKMICTLGAQVDESLELAIKSIQKKDEELAKKVIKNDRLIDQMEVEVEEECLKALALYQPVAIDLRFIASIIKMTSDLERIGDLAADIAKNGISLNQLPASKVPVDLHQMSYLTKQNVRKSLDALIHLDTTLAREVIKNDEEINTLKSEIKHEIVNALQSDSTYAASLLEQLAISHRLERIGDHASNIAEDVIYMLEAEIVRHQQV